MPRGDGTGPWGAGPMTGRGAGYCAGYIVPEYAHPRRVYGRGFGRGWRKYSGRGWIAYPPPTIIQPTTPAPPEQEIAALENYQKDLTVEKADLEQEMNGLKDKIEELKAKLAKLDSQKE